MLLRNLATARVERDFERVYSEIFDSQIRALAELNQAGGTAPRADAVRFYEQVQQKFPHAFADKTFSQWFQYLQRNYLAEEKGGNIVLTDIGRDFLEFVQRYKAGFVRAL